MKYYLFTNYEFEKGEIETFELSEKDRLEARCVEVMKNEGTCRVFKGKELVIEKVIVTEKVKIDE